MCGEGSSTDMGAKAIESVDSASEAVNGADGQGCADWVPHLSAVGAHAGVDAVDRADRVDAMD